MDRIDAKVITALERALSECGSVTMTMIHKRVDIPRICRQTIVKRVKRLVDEGRIIALKTTELQKNGKPRMTRTVYELPRPE